MSAKLYGGGSVSHGTLLVHLNKPGVYKLCVAENVNPMSDAQFKVATGVFLSVEVAPYRVDLYTVVSSILGTLASAVAVCGACYSSFKCYRRKICRKATVLDPPKIEMPLSNLLESTTTRSDVQDQECSSSHRREMGR